MTKAPKSIEQSWPASKVELWPLGKIKPYDKNSRMHSPEQVDLIAASMRVEGVTSPILVDEDGVIIYGHGRKMAAEINGFKQYPVIVARGWSDQQKRAYRIKDNSLALLSTWSPELLRVEMNDLSISGFDLPLLGFDAGQMVSFGFNVGESDFPMLSTDDRTPFQQLTFTLHDSQVDVVKAAMSAAKSSGPFKGPNENSNGNALARICQFYKEASEREVDPGRANLPAGRKRSSQAASLQRENRPK